MTQDGEGGYRIRFDWGELAVPSGASVLVGRDASSPVERHLDQFMKVSREHCTLSATVDSLRVTDRSINGTYVNGERIPTGTPVPLRPGDLLGLARVVTGEVLAGLS